MVQNSAIQVSYPHKDCGGERQVNKAGRQAEERNRSKGRGTKNPIHRCGLLHFFLPRRKGEIKRQPKKVRHAQKYGLLKFL
jgi:hypothetical protein